MLDALNPALKVDIPPLDQEIPFTPEVPLVNANPQCGPFPFTAICSDIDLKKGLEGVTVQADLSADFIKAQILPRGRPHFSLIHTALVDDAIAVTSLTGTTGMVYGETHRYIEMGVVVGFQREAFIRGSNQRRQFGTIFVDGFRTRWRALPEKDNISVLQRGRFQVSVYGLHGFDETLVACVEGKYMRRRAV